MRKVVILGAGGFAREVLDIFLAQNALEPQYELLGFVDDNLAKKGQILNGHRVLGDFMWFDSVDRNAMEVICGIGSSASRYRVVHKALARGLRFCNITHPTAVVTPFVSTGIGVVITAGCILTNQIRIGNHVQINLNSTVGHDSQIEDFCTLAPGVHISGSVHIQTGCEVGTGVCTIQGVTLGEWSIVGAGAVVTHDIPQNSTAVGVPARVVKTREPGWYRS